MKKITKSKVLSVVLVFSLLFGLVGCGNEEEENKTQDTVVDSSVVDEKSNELKTLTIGTPGSDVSNALVLTKVALKQGYLEEELNEIGYTADIQAFQGAGPEINAALASAALDIAVYGDLPAINNNAKGAKTTVIAMDCGKWKYGILYNNEEIIEGADLAGKNIVVASGTVTDYIWDQYIADTGLDSTDISTINSNDYASLLSTGDADAAVVPVSGAYYNAKKDVGTVLSMNDAPNSYASFVVAIRDDVLEENTDIAVAFNKALIRAYQDVKENPQIFFESMATKEMTEDIYKDAFSYMTDYSELSPEITDEVVEHLNKLDEWLVDKKVLEEKLDISTIIDASYYEQAKNELK